VCGVQDKVWLANLRCNRFVRSLTGWGLVWGQWQAQYTTVNFAGEKESVVALIGGLNAFVSEGSPQGFERVLTTHF
jgi:hypothetical protein